MDNNNKRMAKNTVFMYFRMFLLIGVQLYTVPVVLKALGVEDYGIYQVVGGFVLMFGFINGSLVSGCQRFISYALGTSDYEVLKKTFDVTRTIFLILSIFCFILIEIVGIWFLNFKMNIPIERMSAANWVLQLSILSFVVNLITTPYSSSIIAHEQMSIFAYVSIAEAIFKLGIALSLSLICGDLLKIYALLILFASIGVLIFYRIYNKRNFLEAKCLKYRWDSNLFRDIGGYAGWNVVGAVALTLRNQGLNVVMNIFYGPVINAAHAIASQINGLFSQFVGNVYMATRPQMVKQYAQGNPEGMWNIANKSGKYAFYLMAYLTIPVFLEMDYFLHLWLDEVPLYTSVIARLFILATLIETLTNQVIGAFQAANKIKYYQSVSSVILLAIVPISYISLKCYNNPIMPYVLSALISVLYVISLVVIAKKQINLNTKTFLKEVVFRSVVPFILSIVLCFIINTFLSESFVRMIFSGFISIFSTSFFVYMFGLDIEERKYVKIYLKRKIQK